MMKTKPIKADLTEIIFEGRFRAYGAYQLRKLYNQRLAIATFIGLGLFFAGIGAPNLTPGKKRLNHGVGGASTFLDTVVVKFTERERDKSPSGTIEPWITDCHFGPFSTHPEITYKMPNPKNMGEAIHEEFRKKNGFSTALLTSSPSDTPEPDFIVCGPLFEPEPVNYDSVRELIGYPEIAFINEIEGMVVMRVRLDITGTVIEWKTIKRAHPILEEAVEKYIGKLRFDPVSPKAPSHFFFMNVPFRFQLLE